MRLPLSIPRVRVECIGEQISVRLVAGSTESVPIGGGVISRLPV